MNYKVVLSKEAIKTLDKIDRNLEKRMREAMRLLEEEPNQAGKAVIAMQGLRSLRVGDWRILYTVQTSNDTVCVLAIRCRGGAYRF